MALPKKRQSKARSRKRRTHYKSNAVATTRCAQCSQTEHAQIADTIAVVRLFLPNQSPF